MTKPYVALRRTAVSILFGAAIVVASACGSADSNTGTRSVGGSTASFTGTTISGANCTNRKDIYQTGMLRLHSSPNWEDRDPNAIDGVLDDSILIIGDGREDAPGGGTRIETIPSAMAEQVRASYRDYMIIPGGGRAEPKTLILYGNPPGETDDYDGKPNSGLNACVAA
ncbi:hypothetical protein GKZ92_23150 (plasmid) [Gordonia sp. 135]|uniref:hypothetical protein n=1 Tax=Gordonia sp. 135 TaxID=2676309 RepID=UPI0012BB33F8|nr:hypothetical protein [Gordonia sp. 135]QGP90610.1 hypothetical protein GKZ92_23150 [Gordonia sp. 135]